MRRDFARESELTEDWYTRKPENDKEITEASMPTHKEAIQMVLEALPMRKQVRSRVLQRLMQLVIVSYMAARNLLLLQSLQMR